MQVLLIFLIITVMYTSRLNASVSIVAMTDAATTNINFPEYSWSEQEKSYILSSFYWGYMLSQFPGGFFTKLMGAKIVVIISTLGSGICSLAVPIYIPMGGWQAYTVIRVVQGLFQGLMFPALHDHISKWLPNDERLVLSALSHTGLDFGMMLSLLTTGLIAGSSLGWPGISYIAAGSTFCCTILWCIFACNNAPSSRYISLAEKIYIEKSLNHTNNFHKQKIPIPWRAIWTSVPFWILLLTDCAEAWGITTIQAQIPAYMHGVLNMDINNNAIFSSLPFILMWIMAYILLAISYFMQRQTSYNSDQIRKIATTIGVWITAVGLKAIGFLNSDNSEWAIALMCISVVIFSFCTKLFHLVVKF